MNKNFIGKCEFCGIRYIPKTFDYHKHCKNAYKKAIEDIKIKISQGNGGLTK